MHCSIVRCIHTLIYFMYLSVWVDSDDLAQNLGNSGADRCCCGIAQLKPWLYDLVRGACVFDPCVFECFIYNSVGQ